MVVLIISLSGVVIRKCVNDGVTSHLTVLLLDSEMYSITYLAVITGSHTPVSKSAVTSTANYQCVGMPMTLCRELCGVAMLNSK